MRREMNTGPGAGLAIAKSMAKLFNTELSCHSRLNKGTVFEFSLPLADEQASPSHAKYRRAQ